jgi:hypothetical protein
MRTPTRRSLTLLAVLALAVGGCATSATRTESPSATEVEATSTPSPASPSEAPVATEPPEPTEVPGGASLTPPPPPSEGSTTQTDWGAILDGVPDAFPLFPGADVAEPPSAPVSGAFITAAGVDEVAAWYRDALGAAGYGMVDVSEPLEDGSRVIDVQGDLPECRIQITVRPAGESTMITVLYGAGCAGGEG